MGNCGAFVTCPLLETYTHQPEKLLGLVDWQIGELAHW